MNIKKLLLTILFAGLNGLACALMLKAAVGVSPWDGLNNTISIISNIKVGTLCIFTNASFIVGTYLLLKDKFPKRYLLQIIPILIFGTVVNFFYYNILNFQLNNYVLRLIVLILGVILSSFAVGGITVVDFISFPIEIFCKVLSEKVKFSFSQIRQSIDVISLIISLLLCFIFKISLTVREGTIIALLIYAPLMSFFMKKIEKYI